jgi:hypothetical protein
MPSRIILAGMFGAALACASPTAPSAVLSSFQVAGGVSSGPLEAPAVHVSRGRITVSAATNTPTPCYTLSAGFNAADRELKLHVTARPTQPGCILVLGRFSYTAIIGAPAGTYTLVVMHEFPDTGWPATEIVRQTVNVD